ncbi:MAG: hypothetical protein AVDCRST_MAG68-944 [uncultured Gemmatimonadetes bacterium]|uniref:Uncharacterized protein n=1 Tax=uncultured Gemmatimonadota bacterium TaxID=203437 RepID=A0A6J4KJU5_9BACT|nr:MAG: hypothetical protein AVDCRST_MAG68-944 [uncultured Gemmatimonadota bacterium]
MQPVTALRLVTGRYWNLLIKGCRFVRCAFVDCVTTNKLFETCLVLDCRFERTELQVQTITGNFGISADQLWDCPIRSHDPKVAFDYVDLASLDEIATAKTRLAPVEHLRVAYFLSRDVLWGSDALDAALDARGWLQLCRIPSTFAIILQDFSEFLLWVYDRNELTVHPLLLLHTVTSQLSARFGGDAGVNPRVSRAIMGVHMQLSRSVEEFLGVLSGLALDAGDRVRFVANGPLEPAYYHLELAHVFVGDEVRLVEVKPHNSPVELVFEWVSQHSLLCLLAAFAASRVQAELHQLSALLPPPREEEVQEKGGRKRVGSRQSKKAPGLRRVAGVSRDSIELFSYSMGFTSGKSRAYELKARALLPGSLLLELRLEISTGILRPFRRILLKLLSAQEISN